MTQRLTGVLILSTALFWLGLAVLVGKAVAGSPSVMPFDYFKPRYANNRWDTHAIRKKKCLDHSGPHLWKNPREIAPLWREWKLNWARAQKAKAQARDARCRPVHPAAIIRWWFPAATEEGAIRVAYCESRLSPTAYNESSGAAGLFQFIRGHYTDDYGNWTWNPFDPWVNTKMAYRLSNAGYDWSHWVCKP